MSKMETCPAEYVTAVRAGDVDREGLRTFLRKPARPLLGFVRFLEWLPESEVEESTELDELASLDLVPFAEDGTGQRWDFHGSEVVFIADQPTVVRAYAPTFGRFLQRLALESLTELECEFGGEPVTVADMSSVVRANIAATCRYVEQADAELLQAIVRGAPAPLPRARRFDRVSWVSEQEVHRLVATWAWPRLDSILAGPLLG